VAQKRGISITFKDFLKIGIVALLITIFMENFLLLFKNI